MKITIRDIEFSYNGTPALENINNRFEKGDFVALVGPNGSGKSTFLKCLNGILKLQKGTILVDNEEIDSFTPAQLAGKMAYVPQNESKKPSTNVFDIVLLGRKPYINWRPGKHDLEVTAEVLKMLHLEHLAMRDFNKLSGGQQQSVYIARALAQEADILLLDEPTSSLDIKHQVEVLELLKRLSENGITIVIALHDINMATRFATKIMMLKEGRIFASGGKEVVTEETIGDLYGIKVRILREDSHVFVIPF